MIVPKSTKLQDTIKNNLNIEIIKTQLISELQKEQEKLINTTKKLNKTLFDIDQSLFEKQEISAQLDKLKKIKSLFPKVSFNTFVASEKIGPIKTLTPSLTALLVASIAPDGVPLVS